MQKSNNLQKSYLSLTVVGAVGLALTSPAWATIVPMPEPDTFALMGLGFVIAILIARYAKKK